MNKTDLEAFIGEKEFSAEADRLLEFIHQLYRRRDGVDISRKDAIKVAVKILESRP